MRNWGDEAKRIINAWTTTIDDITPVIFADPLAELFFTNTISQALEFAYRIGIKDERKRQKRKSVARWLRNRSVNKS